MIMIKHNITKEKVELQFQLPTDEKKNQQIFLKNNVSLTEGLIAVEVVQILQKFFRTERLNAETFVFEVTFKVKFPTKILVFHVPFCL